MDPFRHAYATVAAIAVAVMSSVSDAQIPLSLGDDFMDVIESHPAGSTFELQPGIHRGQEIQLRGGDTLVGKPGAMMSGAEVLTGWRFEAPFWVHDGPHAKVVPDYDESVRFWEFRATRPHDLFVDDVPLIQKNVTAWVTGDEYWAYDYDADKVYIRFNPEGRRMELSGLCRYGLRTRASGVTVRGIHFDKYATTGQSGAVELGSHAVVEDCIVTGSHATGIRIGSNTRVRKSRFAWNGLAGLHNGGNGSLVEYCEFDHNGWAGFSGNWSRGGMKMPTVTNMVIRRNYAHHNTGPGFWFDINAHDNLFEENLSEFNSWEGLLFELSCECEIRNNIMRWNGLEPRGGLLWGVPFIIQNSEAANVHHNYFEAAPDEGARGGGVSIINQNRPQHTDGVCADHVTEKNHIHNNVMVMPNGGYNGLQYGSFGWDSYQDFLAAGNLWENNTYLTGAPVSGNFHWYEQGESESDFVSSFHSWPGWQGLGQDVESNFLGRHRAFFNAANPQLDELIKATTGVSYAELKAPFIKPAFDPAIDNDGDGLPDGWELSYGLDPLLADADGDMDGDGLSNLEEYRRDMNPSSGDTDGDGLPDGWELSNGLDPIVADTLGDPDADGLVNLEEFEAGLSPRTVDPIAGVFPDAGLSMWLKSGVSLNVNDTWQVTSWVDWRDNEHIRMQTSHTLSGPLISKTPINGYPVLEFGPLNLKTSGDDIFGAESDGWTLMMVLRPGRADGSSSAYALLGNSVWRESGFRLTIEQGYLHFYSTQPARPLSVRSFRRLEEGETRVITLLYDGLNEEGRIYIDGEEQGRAGGWVPANAEALSIGRIGGMTSQPAGVAELITFSRSLTHLDRREVESMLLAKYQASGIARADSDGDGMADWWEIEYGGVDGPGEDPDNDGLLNIDEFRYRTNPVSGDTDGDTLSDRWEVDNNWNPRRDDSAIDDDDDGLSSVSEQIAGTLPDNPDSDADGMPDGWELAYRLNPLANDAGGDRDGDGLTNIQEFDSGTSPVLLDTDGDTLDDLWELTNGWNPLTNDSAVDTDGDGVNDVKEVHYGTDISLKDTDGDGFDDGEELAQGSDPNDPESTPNLPPELGTKEFLVSRAANDGTIIGDFPDTDANGDPVAYTILDNVDPDRDGNNAFRIEGNRFLVNDGGDVRYHFREVPIATGAYHNIALGQQGKVFGWGRNGNGQVDIPAQLGQIGALVTGLEHSMALDGKGLVQSWGSNQFGQGNVPDNLGVVSAIAAGAYHSLALKSNGTIAAWGRNNYGQVNVPGHTGTVSAISAGAWHSMALLEDGRVMSWGINNWDQRNVPAGLDSVISISAGALHSLSLQAEGRVVAWGQNSHGQGQVPAGLRKVVAISAGGYHNLALRENGTVVAWGHNNYGQASVPAKLTGVIAVFAGGYHSLALQSDGTVVAWGRNTDGQLAVPEGLVIDRSRLIRPEILQVKVQANDGANLIDEIITVTLVDDPGGDLDGDGLPYAAEVIAGTDPLFPDSDRDGMHDGWEVGNRLDPLFDDSARDFDFDGVSNVDELVAGSSPVEWLDLDNDGMHDGWELQYGLAVGRADGVTDNDGDLQSNFMEFVFGGNPTDVGSVSGLRARLEDMEFPVIEFQRSLTVSRYYYHIYLETLTDELTWEPLPASRLSFTNPGGGIEKAVLRPSAGDKGYYRIKVVPRF